MKGRAITVEAALTVDQVAERLTVQVKTARKFFTRHQLSGAYKIGGAWRIDRKHLEAYIESKRRENLPISVPQLDVNLNQGTPFSRQPGAKRFM